MNEEFIELDEELVIPVPKQVEFRLYYNDDGSIMYYTTEELPGKYIVVTKEIYAEGRHDVKVENESVVRLANKIVISKLEKSINGVKCASEDINILVSNDYSGETTHWELIRHEF